MVGCVGTHLRMEMPGQIRGLFGDQVAAMGPRIDDGVQDLIKSRHASAAMWAANTCRHKRAASQASRGKERGQPPRTPIVWTACV